MTHAVPMNHRNHTAGFTLMELLVVVAIIAILAAIAVPQYSDYTLRAKLTEATSSLGQQRVRMEQYFQDNRGYPATGTAPCATVTGKYFTVTCAAPTTTTYTLTATGAQGADGFSYTVNETNARTTTITSPATWAAGTSNCWVTSKSGC